MTNKSSNSILLISGDNSYNDHWEGDVFYYHGSGRPDKGDQDPENKGVGNYYLTHSLELGKDILLFRKGKNGCKYIGEMELESAPYMDYDVEEMRNLLVYRLRCRGYSNTTSDDIARLTEAQLVDKIRTVTDVYKRNAYVKAYALKKSKGICELCGNQAPFNKPNGEPYLEVHHIVPLSEGGIDDERNVCALCPNCHRKIHVVKDERDIAKLMRIATNTR